MKKKFFDVSFDPKMQPGYASRHKSLEGFMGVTVDPEKPERNRVVSQNMSYDGFASSTVWQTLPSRQYRKFGKV